MIKKEYFLDRDFGPEAELTECPWSPNLAPAAAFSAAFDAERGLRFLLRSMAAPSRAVNTEPDSSVWEDSCLECFFSFDGKNYVNLEANAKGALRAAIGPDRQRRWFLQELGVPMPRAEARVGEDEWEVLFTVPTETVRALFRMTPGSGCRFKANFYSCGDATPAPHYAAWNPVETEKPDFHRPEYFGTLLIK